MRSNCEMLHAHFAASRPQARSLGALGLQYLMHKAAVAGRDHGTNSFALYIALKSDMANPRESRPKLKRSFLVVSSFQAFSWAIR